MSGLRRFFARYGIWLGVLALVALAGLGFYLVRQYRPSKELTLATGRPGGAYYAFAEEYQKLLAEQGYTLNIVPTAGSVETLELLKQGEVDAGFVQTYVARDRDVAGLVSLASLFYEPLWIFYRPDRIERPVARLADLRGLTIGAGEAGSGTQAVAEFVLAENGITAENTTLLTLTNAEASRQLLAGELDAAMMISAVESEVLQELVTSPEVEILSIDRAPAYQLRYGDMAVIALPQGAIDLARDIPRTDKTLLAAVAMLVAQEDIALDWERLLLTTAVAVHGEGGLLETRGEFPSSQYVDIPISSDALAYLEHGSTGLDRFLPLWIASRLEWMLFVIVPLLIVIYPLLRGGPVAFASFTRFRIYRGYKRLRRIDAGINRYSLSELDQHIAELAQARASVVSRMNVPILYLNDLYALIYQMDIVSNRLMERRRVLAEGARQIEASVAGGAPEPDGVPEQDGAPEYDGEQAGDAVVAPGVTSGAARGEAEAESQSGAGT